MFAKKGTKASQLLGLRRDLKVGAMFLFEPCAAWRRTAKGKNRESGLELFALAKRRRANRPRNRFYDRSPLWGLFYWVNNDLLCAAGFG